MVKGGETTHTDLQGREISELEKSLVELRLRWIPGVGLSGVIVFESTLGFVPIVLIVFCRFSESFKNQNPRDTVLGPCFGFYITNNIVPI